MGLPLEVIAEEPRTINAWVSPQVTEGGEPFQLVGMEEAPAVTALGQTPPDQPHGGPYDQPDSHLAGGLPPADSLRTHDRRFPCAPRVPGGWTW